jgi:hypothetical protein
MKKIFLLIIFLTISYILRPTPCFAVSMDSSRFKIESVDISITSGNKSSTSYKLSDTVGQTAAGQFSSTGYIVKAGFQYLHSIIPFRFSVSDVSIDFGTLTPNSPSTAKTTLNVYFGDAGQYQVAAIEEGQLKTLAGTAIPDTSCDGGSNTCNKSLAKTWTSNSAYGFGYNMMGNDVPADFVDSTYYRPFPDQTISESPAVIISNLNVGKNRQSIVTFKTNISPIQPAGSYQTVINFVATPSY